MNTDNVGQQQPLSPRNQLNTQLCRALTCQTPAPRNHRHAKRTRPSESSPARFCRRRLDQASVQTNHALWKTPSCSTCLVARRQRCPRCDDRARESGEGELGNGDRIFPDNSKRRSRVLRQRRRRSIVVARAGANDGFTGPAKHRLRHLRTAHHEHVGRDLPHRFDERVVF